jgi:redox-sensing transcriptional repressor
MPTKQIPDIVIGRLPIYMRALTHMLQEGKQITSSQELGERLGISAAQIRKDLSQFGEFGKQGTGYNIQFLTTRLAEILNIDRIWPVAIVGAGDLGSALAHYSGFKERGFQVQMIFDNDPEKIGKTIGDFVVQNSKDMVKEIKTADITVAMLVVPASVAQEVTKQLIEAGVRAILNYAPVFLNVPNGVYVQNIDPSTHLQRMTYYLD